MQFEKQYDGDKVFPSYKKGIPEFQSKDKMLLLSFAKDADRKVLKQFAKVLEDEISFLEGALDEQGENIDDPMNPDDEIFGLGNATGLLKLNMFKARVADFAKYLEKDRVVPGFVASHMQNMLFLMSDLGIGRSVREQLAELYTDQMDGTLLDHNEGTVTELQALIAALEV